jgi:PAS domain S-box-containing protein
MTAAGDTLFSRGGTMAARMAALDWASTPLGPSEAWPQSLRAVVRVLLTSRYAMWMAWGPELTFFCNDAYLPTLGVKQSWALGSRSSKVWEEIWPDIGPRVDHVLQTAEATWDEGLLLFLQRSGYPEETYHTFSYSPLSDDGGRVAGMLCVVTEETNRIIGERRLGVLRDLAAELSSSNSQTEVCAAIERLLPRAQRDFPFAMAYFCDDSAHTTLAFGCGVKSRQAGAATQADLSGPDAGWPIQQVLDSGETILVENLSDRFADLSTGGWSRPPDRAVLVPMTRAGQSRPVGVFIAGINPFRPWDDTYRDFVGLFVGQLTAAVNNAHAYEQERRRAEALTEIDRAKTTFFSKISHEFRTPLTLMLGPLMDTLSLQNGPLPQRVTEELSVVHRNGLRLLKLVNTLLEFSRIEAGRVKATYVPTDLSAYTAELASVFRSAMEKAGLTLSIQTPPLVAAAYVDRDMWEKIVLNLLSNAFKFTLTGGIIVRLSSDDKSIQLQVQDTGSGIPAEELPRLFERFHRVEGTRGRTHEGTGIGLALVHELVRLHGGHVQVASELGAGTTFTISIPAGRNHLPADRIVEDQPLPLVSDEFNPFVEEALRWLPDQMQDIDRDLLVKDSDLPVIPATRGSATGVSALGGSGPDVAVAGRSVAGRSAAGTSVAGRSAAGLRAQDRPRIVVADDNNDMRGYLLRLLSDRYDVVAAVDGQQALDAARAELPALILSDVMMPNLDGFGLLKEVQHDPVLAGVPVILLSARAGEEATLDGLRAGADDYILKPFSARELLARVEAQIERKRYERRIAAAEQRLQSALAAAKMGAWEWDPVTDVVKASSTIADVFGLAPGQAMDTSRFGFTLVHPDDRERHRTLVTAAAARGQGYYAEFRIIRPLDGRVAWMEERAQFVKHARTGQPRLVGLVIDVTDRKQNELALARSEERLAFAVEAADLGTFYCPLPLGNIIWNDKCCEHFFIEPGTRLDIEEFYLLLHPDDRLRTRRAVEQAVFEHKPYDIDYRAVAKDGRIRWIRAKGRAYHDGKGTPTRFDGITLDITELKQVEEQRELTLAAERTAREEAERVSRMKDEFLATLSHELRTPLNAILGWSQILSTPNATPEDVRDGVEAVHRNARAQTQMIEDLLDMSRIISGKVRLDVQRLLVADVVEAAVQSVRPSADVKRIRLTTVLDPYAGPVAGDFNRLQQVVWNLLSNAIKFTPAGGKIQVVLERVNSHLELSVADSGEGIDPEFLPFVFERFRQADSSTTRKHGGLGLGLNIVKQLIELHGGSVRAKSPGAGKGSTFTLSLPLAASTDPAHAEASATRQHPRITSNDSSIAPLPNLKGVTVLVVDDDADAREVMKRILGTSGGATVQVAASAAEALQLMKSNRPDVLISDIGMPDVDGYELIRKVRALPQDTGGKIPAVALTAFARSEDRQRALRAGYQIHVAKPVEPVELLTVCASLTGRL